MPLLRFVDSRSIHYLARNVILDQPESGIALFLIINKNDHLALYGAAFFIRHKLGLIWSRCRSSVLAYLIVRLLTMLAILLLRLL